MKMKTLIAVAVAGAFAVPFAAQASVDNDRIILAQAGGAAGGAAGTGGAGAPGSTTPGGAAAQSGAGASGGGQTGAQGSQGAGGSGPMPSTQSGSGATADLSSLDKNNDGYISRDEAASHPSLSTRFTELDTNNDGRLSASEVSGAAGAGATTQPDPAKSQGDKPGTTR